jgi:hypothetical protein
MTTGVIFVGTSDRPTLSLDLCHPLQAAAVATIGVVAQPAPIEFKPQLCPSTSASRERPSTLSRLLDAPESPPPEIRV